MSSEKEKFDGYKFSTEVKEEICKAIKGRFPGEYDERIHEMVIDKFEQGIEPDKDSLLLQQVGHQFCLAFMMREKEKEDDIPGSE